MAYQIFIALTTEGTADKRFLQNIVEQAFIYVAVDCSKDVDILGITCLETTKVGKDDFTDYILEASKEACGYTTMAVHVDSDKESYDVRKQHTIDKALIKLGTKSEDEYCKVITPVISVRMIEAWMLTDIDLLRDEIGTSLTAAQLGLDGVPESMADPKVKIEEAIRIAKRASSHRRPTKGITISDLYETLGQKLKPEILKKSNSYQLFLNEIENLYRSLNLML